MNATQVILGAVIVLVLTYFARCWQLIRLSRPSTRLARLRDELLPGIDEGVASGRTLDWVYYTEEAQRKHEDLREHLRNYGTISLATGVGGTMAALAWHLLTVDASQDGALDQLLGEMGLALVASGSGVLGNLAILWGLLPWANGRFNPELDDHLEKLRRAEKAALKKSKTAVAILGEAATVLDGAAKKLDGDVTKLTAATIALTESTSSLHQMPELGGALGGLSAEVIALREDMRKWESALQGAVETAGDQHRRAADRLAEDITKLPVAINALTESTSNLHQMPEKLDKVLNRAREGLSAEANALRDDMRKWESERRGATEEWLATLKSAVETAGTQHREAADRLDGTARVVEASMNLAVGKLAETTEAVRESVRGLPDLVAAAVERSGESLGRRFSDAVEPTVTSFRDGVAGGLAKTIEWQKAVSEHLAEARRQHDRTVRDLTSATEKVVKSVQSLPAGVAEAVRQVSDRLGREFGHEARQHVEQLRKTLTEHADKLQRRLERHESNLLNTTVRKLQEVSEKLINQTVRDLGEISGQLQEVLDGFPSHVADVNARLREAEGGLAEIVNRINAISTALRSAHDRTDESLAGLVSATQGLGQVIRDYSEAHASAIGDLADALRKPRRRRWWRRVLRRSRDEEPGLDQDQEAA